MLKQYCSFDSKIEVLSSQSLHNKHLIFLIIFKCFVNFKFLKSVNNFYCSIDETKNILVLQGLATIFIQSPQKIRWSENKELLTLACKFLSDEDAVKDYHMAEHYINKI